MKAKAKKKTAKKNSYARVYTDPRADISEDFLLDMVHLLETDVGQRKIDSTKYFMGWLAWHLEHRKHLPDFAADWLAQALLRVTHFGISADTAFGLKPGGGRKTDLQSTMRCAAHLHVLISCGMKKEPAAKVVAAFFEKSESSWIIKDYNLLAKRWSIKVPMLWDHMAQDWKKGTTSELVNSLVTTEDAVWVVFRSPGHTVKSSFRVMPDFWEHVMKSTRILAME